MAIHFNVTKTLLFMLYQSRFHIRAEKQILHHQTWSNHGQTMVKIAVLLKNLNI